MFRSTAFTLTALTIALLAGCAQPAMVAPSMTPMAQSAAKKTPGADASDEIKAAIRSQMERRTPDNSATFKSLNVSPTPLGTLFTFEGVLQVSTLAGPKNYQVTGTYNSVTNKVAVTKQSLMDSKTANATIEAASAVRAQLERHMPDNAATFKTLSISPTPLGTLFTFEGTLQVISIAGATNYTVTGTYNSLTNKVTVTRQERQTATR